jgi:hypothetical protein
MWVAVCAAICSGVLGLYELLSLANQSETILGRLIVGITEPGMGLYLLIASSLCIVLTLTLSPFLFRKK